MFWRIANLFRGFMGLFVSGLERRNPQALLEVEKENLRKQVARYNDGLASHAGLCERLMTQVRKLEGDQRDLRARASANLKAGNRELAGQYAMRLQTVERELDENRKQLAQAEDTYKNLVTARETAVSAAKAKIEALRQSLDDLKVKKAMAELTEMASGMVSQIGGSGDTLDRLHSMVEQEREKAAGRVRVAQRQLQHHRDPHEGSGAKGAGRSGLGRLRCPRRHHARCGICNCGRRRGDARRWDRP